MCRDARVANASSSAVFIYSSNSLGSGPVAFNRNYGSGEGARLVVDGSRGTRDFVVGASSVTLSFWTGCPVWLRVQNGVRSVSFSGPFVSQASLSYTVTAAQITAGELEEIVFSDTMTCGSWHTLANYVTFRFHGAILGSTLTAGSGTTAHI